MTGGGDLEQLMQLRGDCAIGTCRSSSASTVSEQKGRAELRTSSEAAIAILSRRRWYRNCCTLSSLLCAGQPKVKKVLSDVMPDDITLVTSKPVPAREQPTFNYCVIH